MATEAASGSLSSAFNLKSLLHVGHSLMMVSMAAAAISMVVSSGGAVGFLDPFMPFFDMFIPEAEHLAAIPDFISSAYDSAVNGTWLTDQAFNLAADPHAAHVASAAQAGEVLSHHHACTDQGQKFAEWMLGDPSEITALNQDAQAVGMNVWDYFVENLCHG
jgi:hypothetical protein